MALLPCQEALMDSRQDTTDGCNALRTYRCEIDDHWCVISGVGPDDDLLSIFCEGCNKAASLE